MRPVRDLPRSAPRWSDLVFREVRRPVNGRFPIGLLPGEGVGPEVVGAALTVLSALETGGSPLRRRGGRADRPRCRGAVGPSAHG